MIIDTEQSNHGIMRTVAKSTFILIMTRIDHKILTLILIIYVAQYLGDAGFGKYAFAVALAGLFIVFSDLGLSTLAIREIARNKNKREEYLGNASTIKEGKS